MKTKLAKRVFQFQTNEVESNKIAVKIEFIIDKKIWLRVIRWGMTLLISVLILLNVPGVELLLR